MAAIVVAGCAGARPALPTADPSSLGLSPAKLAAIRPALQAYVDSGKLGGVYAVIARNGYIGYELTVGWQDVGERTPLERDAVFRIFSMTKPVIAAGAMKLIDQGRLSLDDPVSKYIPAFAGAKVFAGGSADAPVVRAADSVMTVRHLLTHTAGLPYGLTREPADSIFSRARLYHAASTLAEFADSIAKLPLLFTPGTRWSYSSSLEIVGRIIEVVSGQPLDRFMKQGLFEPLGMKDTSFRLDEDVDDDKVVVLYERGEDGRLAVLRGGLLDMYEPEARFYWASGGLLSTPDDYLRFAQMLLNGGELNGVRVLSRESVAAMTSSQVAEPLLPHPRTTLIDEGYGFGLAGSVLVDATRTRVPGAAGIYRWSGYVGTYFWIDPQNQLVGMVWTQHNPGRLYPLEAEFQRMVYDALSR